MKPEVPGEQYVPPDFKPVVVSGVVRKIRSILFGANPDRHMLNFRLTQLLPVLHETELEEFVLAYDPRITYWPSQVDEFYQAAFTPQIISDGSGTLSLLGSLSPDEANGRINHAWRIEVTGASTVSVRRTVPPLTSRNVTYTLTDGLSGPIELLGSTLSFHFSGGSGNSWTIRATARPQRTAADILQSLTDTLTESDDIELFDAPYQEPKLTWRNLWRDHPDGFYRLGGLLLGLANKMHTGLGR